MPITPLQYLQMQERLRIHQNVCRRPAKDEDAREVGHGGLHEKIMAWCDAQWPRWKYLHSRTDKRTTVAVGSQDFTIFCPQGMVLCIECKRPGGKRTEEQMGWALEMELLGHIVHVVTTMQEFLALTVAARIQEPTPKPPHNEPPSPTSPPRSDNQRRP